MDDTNRQTQETRPRKKRKVLKILAVILFLFILLIFFLPPVILSSSFVKQKIVDSVNENPDITMSLGNISFGWFKGFKLTDIKIDDSAGGIYNIKSAKAKVLLISYLLRGKLIIQDAIIDHPEITITVHQDTTGKNVRTDSKSKDIPTVKPDKPANDFDYSFIEFKIVSGQVNMSLVKDDHTQLVTLKNINSHTQMNWGKTVFDAEMDIIEGPDTSHIKTSGSLLGKLNNIDKSFINGNIKTDINNLSLKSLYPFIALSSIDMKPEGLFDAQSEIVIRDSKAAIVKLHGSLKDFRNTSTKGTYVLDEEVNISADLRTGDKLQIADMTIKSSFMNLTCSGDKDLINYDLSGDLYKSSAFVSQFIDLEKHNLKGTLESKGSINFSKEHCIVSGETRLNQFQFSHNKKTSPKDDFTINHTFSINQDTDLLSFESIKIISKPANLQLSGSNISAGKFFTSPFELTADGTLDLNRLNKYILMFRDKPLTNAGDSLKVNIISRYTPSGSTEEFALENLIMSTALGIETAEYEGFTLGKTDIYTNLDNGILKILPFDADTNNGKIHFAADIDLNKKPYLLTIPEPVTFTSIEINETIADKYLKHILIFFDRSFNMSDFSDVKGIASADFTKLSIPLDKNYTDKIFIEFSLEIDPLHMAYGGILRDLVKRTDSRANTQQTSLLKSKYILKDGYVTYENTQLNIGDNPFNFSGQVPLDSNKPMKLTVLTPWQASGRTASTDDQADDRIPVKITGTRNNPDLNIENLIEDTIENIGRKLLEKELQKGLEKLFEK